LIQTLFQNYVIKNGKPPGTDMCDEIYLQLYKQTNFGSQPEDKEKSRLMFMVLALVAKYAEPSA
jgi:hypothetical protein